MSSATQFAPPTTNILVRDTGTPPIPEAKAWLSAYDGACGPAIDLSQAAPGEAPPDRLLKALAAAAGAAESARYGSIFGDFGLRQALSDDMRRAYGAAPDPESLAITGGCNLAFMAAALAVAGAGDDIILPAPWYFNHQMTLQMLGVGVSPLPCLAPDGFVPDPARAEAMIGPRSRAIVLVTPNNPTGAIYPAPIIAKFNELCRKRGIFLILDETYRDFLPDDAGPPHDLFGQADWGANLIHLYSFSKSFAIPGHRLGAIACGGALMPEIGKILDSFQICPARAGQMALAGTMPELSDWRQAGRATINRRARVFRDTLAALSEWRIDSIGAYFAYLRHPFAQYSGQMVAQNLATRRGVLTLPGSYFGPGQEHHLRIAFANADATNLAQLARRFADLTFEH
jgi:hypothetical protein